MNSGVHLILFYTVAASQNAPREVI